MQKQLPDFANNLRGESERLSRAKNGDTELDGAAGLTDWLVDWLTAYCPVQAVQYTVCTN